MENVEFEERFEKGMRDLETLKDALEKVHFGNVECYLEEMIRRYKDGEFGCHPTDKDLCDFSDYKESLDSFRDFKPVFQQFVLALRKLPNFR